MFKLLLTALTLLAAPAALGAQATGTISWTAPTQYVDGSPLDPSREIAGYTIYSGSASRNYDYGTIEVGAGGATGQSEVVIEIPGTFQNGDAINIYLAMTATDIQGDISMYSNEVYKSFEVVIDNLIPGPPTSVDLSLPITIECTSSTNGVRCSVTPTN